MIPMAKISPTAIPRVRPVREYSNSFQELREAVISEGQQYPIVIRKLTADEIEAVKTLHPHSEAEYGIIDGQHRYFIAGFNHQNEILATVLTYDPPQDAIERKILDARWALKMNSAIPMTALQKGKILFELEKATGKNITELGLQLFNIKSSMAYKYVQDYKDHNGIKTVIKKREKSIGSQRLNDLADSWNQIPHEESAIDFNDAAKCLEQVEKIKDLEKKLGVIKRIILSQDSVKNEIKHRKDLLAMNVPID